MITFFTAHNDTALIHSSDHKGIVSAAHKIQMVERLSPTPVEAIGAGVKFESGFCEGNFSLVAAYYTGNMYSYDGQIRYSVECEQIVVKYPEFKNYKSRFLPNKTSWSLRDLIDYAYGFMYGNQTIHKYWQTEFSKHTFTEYPNTAIPLSMVAHKRECEKC